MLSAQGVISVNNIYQKLLVNGIICMLLLGSLLIIPGNMSEAGSSSRSSSRDSFNDALAKGVSWLANQQNQDGSWGSTPYRIAYTGFVLTKLQEYAYEIGRSPFDQNYQYSSNVKAGWKFLFSEDSYNDPNYFTRVFKRVLSTSPTSFRNNKMLRQQ